MKRWVHCFYLCRSTEENILSYFKCQQTFCIDINNFSACACAHTHTLQLLNEHQRNFWIVRFSAFFLRFTYLVPHVNVNMVTALWSIMFKIIMRDCWVLNFAINFMVRDIASFIKSINMVIQLFLPITTKVRLNIICITIIQWVFRWYGIMSQSCVKLLPSQKKKFSTNGLLLWR